MILRDFTPGDIEWVWDAVTSWHRCHDWGWPTLTTTLPAVTWQVSDDQAAFQQVAVNDAGSPLALWQVVRVKPDHQFGTLTLLISPGHVAGLQRLAAEFVAHACSALGLRKLCFACLDVNQQVAGCVADANLVGQLTGHERAANGLFNDLLLYEVWPGQEVGR